MAARALFIILLIAISSACSPAAPNNRRPRLIGTVIKIVDGDTIDVQLDSGPIRVSLHAIDAPELGQPHGEFARVALANLVMNRRVALDALGEDRYEGLVAIVFVNGLNANSELVKSGDAFAYRRYMREIDGGLCALEAKARIEKRGIWAQPKADIAAPWEWREREKSGALTDYSGETTARCVAAIGGPA